MVNYLGDGSAWIDGIPARDLTAEDWAELTEAQKAHALASGLYTQAPTVVAQPDAEVSE